MSGSALPVPLPVLAHAAVTGPAAQSNAPSAPPAAADRNKRIKAFLLQHHLPLGLFFFVVLGFLWPAPGIAFGKTPINTISIVGIFFISGLQLQTSEIKKALTAVRAIVLGLVSILALSPLLAFPIAKMDLGTPEFAQGLALFMAMPTTISSGVTMTGEAGGNVALSLFFSVVTNLLGIGSVPFFMQEILVEAGEAASAMNPLDLLLKLTLTILLPLAVGKLLRIVPTIATRAARHKTALKLTSSALLISVPWINMSQSAGKLASASAGSLAALAGLGFALHGFLLVANYAAARLIPGIGLPEQKAVVINSAQKTVNTAVSVIQFLPEGAGDHGMLMLPCIIAHFIQIIMDAVVVAQWKKVKETPTTTPPPPPASAVAGGGGSSAGGDAAVAATPAPPQVALAPASSPGGAGAPPLDIAAVAGTTSSDSGSGGGSSASGPSSSWSLLHAHDVHAAVDVGVLVPPPPPPPPQPSSASAGPPGVQPQGLR